MAYGWKQAQILVRRELDLQHALAQKYALNKVLNVPLLLAPVGSGKTSLAQDEAENRGILFSSFNCGELSDPADFGIPVPQNGESGRLEYIEWCLNKQAFQATQEPVLLFFDDLDKAPPQVQGAFLSIAGSRMFRDRDLHKGTLVIGAGNRLGDDLHANEISESLRTRFTIIEMEPDMKSFVEYGKNGEIHPAVLGYIHYRPEHLHQWKERVNRFPTPRGWWETSRHFEAHPNPFEDVFGNGANDNWRDIVSRKCGHHVGSDFWAWFKIIQRVDVDEILSTGKLRVAPDSEGKSDERMMQYAAVYAVSQRLAKGVKKSYGGLPTFMAELKPEMRVAMVVQLPPKTLGEIATTFPAAANSLMEYVVKTTTPTGATLK